MPFDCLQGLEDAGALALTASSTSTRDMRASRRKPARAPSVASSSMRSGRSGFRVKSALLVDRRGSPRTPVPKWKVYGEARMGGKQQGHHHESANLDYDRENCYPQNRPQAPSISARKLAASLWERQELPCSRGGANRSQKGMRAQVFPYTNGYTASIHKSPNVQPFSPASSFRSSKQRRHAISSERTRIHGGPSMAEIGSTTRNLVTGIECISAKLDACGQITTHELVEVLNHLRNLEERQTQNMSLVAALRAELDQARAQLQGLLLKEKAQSKEVECVTKRMVEEKALWQEHHEKSMRVTLSSMSQDLENERMAKQKLELLHKKVEKELWDTRRKLGKVSQELEKERKARELMEDVCDELSREVGEDKARVEELKRESAKVREEVEEERKMLQMAEVWREERVQMKLMEAKLELEEKNTALDKLRGELETFLKVKRGNDGKEEASLSQHTYKHSLDASSGQSFADVNIQRGLVSGRKSGDSVKQNASRVYTDGHGSDDEDDLHSIELNDEAFVMPKSAQFAPQSAQHHGFVHKGRKSVDQRPSVAPTMQRQTSARLVDKSQGFERLRDQVAKEGNGDVGAEKDGLYDYAQVSQWIERSYEGGGEMSDWRLEQEQPGREESVKAWHHRMNGRSHELVSSSPRMIAMKANHQSRGPVTRSGPVNDCKESSFFSTNQSGWLQRVFDFENVRQNLVHEIGHEGSKLMPSPTRQWTNP